VSDDEVTTPMTRGRTSPDTGCNLEEDRDIVNYEAGECSRTDTP
jgi:hypothetical protein